MSDETESQATSHDRGKRRGGLAWLLLLVAVILVGWFWAPPADNGHTAAADDTLEGADADEVIVDFKDDDSPARVAEVGKQLGLDLQLVSSQSEDERMYRA